MAGLTSQTLSFGQSLLSSETKSPQGPCGSLKTRLYGIIEAWERGPMPGTTRPATPGTPPPSAARPPYHCLRCPVVKECYGL